jgi:hypothetical protein
MTPEYAFRADDPAVLDAYQRARQARVDAGNAMLGEAEKIGKNNGPAVRGGIFGTGDELVGLFADDENDPPLGWVYRKGREMLQPRRGNAGLEAEEFLRRHRTIGGDPRVALAGHGLPTESAVPSRDGSYSLRKPVVFEHDGALYAKYTGEVRHELGNGTGCTWPAIPLSEFYAALEAVQAAERAQEARA